MSTHNKIKELHNSDMFGIFVELGLGNPVTTELCKVPNASRTVFYSENPYGSEISRDLYKIPKEIRLVSLEAVHYILNSERFKHFKTLNDKINTVFVSSFQIGEFNDKVTHGYVGIKYLENIRYYHITLRNSHSRSEYIEQIRNICLNLLFRNVSISDPQIANIDAVWNDDKIGNVEETLLFNNLSSRPLLVHNKTIAYIKDGKILRLEDLTRSAKNGLIIYKGSFNPISKAHLNIIKYSREKFPDYEFCFSISLDTFGKNKASLENISRRIKFINKLGYGVLICQTPYFDDLHIILSASGSSIGYQKEIIYAMGMDTAVRVQECGCQDLPNRQFLIFDRKSSISTISTTTPNLKNSIVINDFNFDIQCTQIREHLKNLQEPNLAGADENQQKIKEMVPEEIFEELIANKQLFIAL